MDSKRSFKPTPHQRILLELARHFTNISNPKHREALCHLARELATIKLVDEEYPAAAVVLTERRRANVA